MMPQLCAHNETMSFFLFKSIHFTGGIGEIEPLNGPFFHSSFQQISQARTSKSHKYQQTHWIA
jgi:hypothetical protein